MREKEQAEARAAAGENWTETGLVFTTSVGTPFEPRNFNRRFEGSRVKAGRNQATCEDRKWPVTWSGWPDLIPYGSLLVKSSRADAADQFAG